MKALARILVAAAGLAPLAVCAEAPRAPTAVAQFAQLQDDLRQSHASGDTQSYLNSARAMYSFLHGSPRATLQLMSAESVFGKQDEALQSFALFVSLGQADEEALAAKQFDPLRSLQKYQATHAAMAANAASLSLASEAFRLSPAVRVPEDIDYDSTEKRFYISSVLGKHIVAVDMRGRSTVFARAPDQWAVMALKIDPRRRILWATEVALEEFTSVAAEDRGRSAILLYDLRSRKLLHRIEGPRPTALGDMALDLNGDAIVSDGEHGGVYRVSRKSLRIERIDGGDFVSPQTPAVLRDGKRILVPDYVRGIGVLDVKTKQVAWLPMEGKHALSGIDGLYVLGNTLIAIQNGTSPERVVQFVLDDSNSRVLSERIIERSTPTLGDPTHGVLVGDYFYYIANSGWDSLDDHGNVIQGKHLPAGSVMRAKI